MMAGSPTLSRAKPGSLKLSWVLVTGVMTDSKDYPTTGSPGLKLYREGRYILEATNLTSARVPSEIETGQQKSAGSRASGGSILSREARSYAFMAPFTASAVIGSERTRAPQALKIALASAGAITVTAGSPTPVACSPLAMTLMATSGI